jgi:hypothetical protein
MSARVLLLIQIPHVNAHVIYTTYVIRGVPQTGTPKLTLLQPWKLLKQLLADKALQSLGYLRLAVQAHFNDHVNMIRVERKLSTMDIVSLKCFLKECVTTVTHSLKIKNLVAVFNFECCHCPQGTIRRAISKHIFFFHRNSPLRVESIANAIEKFICSKKTITFHTLCLAVTSLRKEAERHFVLALLQERKAFILYKNCVYPLVNRPVEFSA